MNESKMNVEDSAERPGQKADESQSDDLQSFLAGFDGEKLEAAEKPDEGKPKSKPQLSDLNALAESLGVEVKDLYSVQIPSSVNGAEAHTLGKLKDLAKDQDDLTVRALKFDESSRRRESELIAEEQRLAMLMESLPKTAIKPEILAKVEQRRLAKLSAECERTMELIPEWSDEAVRSEELKGIVEHLESFGVPGSFLVRHFDAATLRYVRENFVREKRLKEGLAKLKERKPTQQSKSGTVDKTARRGMPNGASPEDRRALSFLNQLSE